MGELQVLIFVKIDQKCLKFHLASDCMAILGSVDSNTSLADDFLCITYGLKHVIEYHKGDKMSIWAIYVPIRAKIHHFYDFAKLCHWWFSFLAINLKVKSLEFWNHAA